VFGECEINCGDVLRQSVVTVLDPRNHNVRGKLQDRSLIRFGNDYRCLSVSLTTRNVLESNLESRTLMSFTISVAISIKVFI
jgi:hypothetical protein